MSILHKNLPSTIRLYLLPVFFFVALVGVNLYIYQTSGHTTPSGSRANSADAGFPHSLPDNLLPLEKVRSLATAEAPNVAITKIRLEQRDAKPAYIVSFANSTQLVFDAQTGKKLDSGVGLVGDTAASLPPFAASLGFDDARDIALAKIPNGVVREIELKTVDSAIVYSVHFTDGSSVTIAATDGSVLPAADTNTDASSAAGTPAASEDQNPSAGGTDSDTAQTTETPTPGADTEQTQDSTTNPAE
jgi:uncharacterized membrane protein YkoI